MAVPNRSTSPIDGLDPVGLASQLYEELRAIARREFGQERLGHTLQPTALANEAYLRLAQQTHRPFKSQAHFLAAAAKTIRRVLVDHARRRATLKRGRDWSCDEESETALEDAPDPEAWIALDAALERLSGVSALKSRIVELRFFAGMENAEIAKALELSISTVRREWRVARAWLRCELEPRDGA